MRKAPSRVFPWVLNISLRGLYCLLKHIAKNQTNRLTHFSQVFSFILKPVIWFALQIKWLVSIWNATLDWKELINCWAIPNQCYNIKNESWTRKSLLTKYSPKKRSCLTLFNSQSQDIWVPDILATKSFQCKIFQ